MTSEPYGAYIDSSFFCQKLGGKSSDFFAKLSTGAVLWPTSQKVACQMKAGSTALLFLGPARLHINFSLQSIYG